MAGGERPAPRPSLPPIAYVALRPTMNQRTARITTKMITNVTMPKPAASIDPSGSEPIDASGIRYERPGSRSSGSRLGVPMFFDVCDADSRAR